MMRLCLNRGASYFLAEAAKPRQHEMVVSWHDMTISWFDMTVSCCNMTILYSFRVPVIGPESLSKTKPTFHLSHWWN